MLSWSVTRSVRQNVNVNVCCVARHGVCRELTTDVSLGLQLDASTVRSERMTPCRFSTAHIKVM
ncbi:Crumbs [Operophtera brumata]|uniref:Crumbs n=1 Tax=Operophtera brumata TaxID=104452 RepID=A0A0L7LDP4_OPEBR|nr:Crumbs [Operophtera brumata]